MWKRNTIVSVTSAMPDYSPGRCGHWPSWISKWLLPQFTCQAQTLNIVRSFLPLLKRNGSPWHGSFRCWQYMYQDKWKLTFPWAHWLWWFHLSLMLMTPLISVSSHIAHLSTAFPSGPLTDTSNTTCLELNHYLTPLSPLLICSHGWWDNYGPKCIR